MARSAKKGPYVQDSLAQKVAKAKDGGKREAEVQDDAQREKIDAVEETAPPAAHEKTGDVGDDAG